MSLYSSFALSAWCLVIIWVNDRWKKGQRRGESGCMNICSKKRRQTHDRSQPFLNSSVTQRTPTSFSPITTGPGEKVHRFPTALMPGTGFVCVLWQFMAKRNHLLLKKTTTFILCESPLDGRLVPLRAKIRGGLFQPGSQEAFFNVHTDTTTSLGKLKTLLTKNIT